MENSFKNILWRGEKTVWVVEEIIREGGIVNMDLFISLLYSSGGWDEQKELWPIVQCWKEKTDSYINVKIQGKRICCFAVMVKSIMVVHGSLAAFISMEPQIIDSCREKTAWQLDACFFPEWQHGF